MLSELYFLRLHIDIRNKQFCLPLEIGHFYGSLLEKNPMKYDLLMTFSMSSVQEQSQKLPFGWKFQLVISLTWPLFRSLFRVLFSSKLDLLKLLFVQTQKYRYRFVTKVSHSVESKILRIELIIVQSIKREEKFPRSYTNSVFQYNLRPPAFKILINIFVV